MLNGPIYAPPTKLRPRPYEIRRTNLIVGLWIAVPLLAGLSMIAYFKYFN